jgi:hypothetical protein
MVQTDPGYTFDYELMPDIGEGATYTEQDQIAKLIWTCGIAVNMAYDYSASGADTLSVRDALHDHFRYAPANWMSGSWPNDWEGTLKQELLALRPVQMSIWESDASLVHHSIVCDGWEEQQTAEPDWFHLNMGMWGAENAWYNVPNFQAFGYTWRVLRGYVYGIQPGVTDPDGYEQDGSAATAKATSTVPGVRPQYRTIGEPGDQDWISFVAWAGATYTIETFEHRRIGGNWRPVIDTRLRLYPSGGSLPLAENNDKAANDAFSRVFWVCPATGTYYAVVDLASNDFGDTGHYDVSVTAFYTISGVVTDESDNPLEGVTVSTSGASSATLANGTYKLTGLVEGTYTVNATAGSSGFHSLKAQPIAVGSAAGNATDVDFKRTPTGYTISGHVRDSATNEGIPEMPVWLDAGTGAARVTMADRQGVFTFADVPAGAHQVKPFHDEWDLVTDAKNPTVPPNQTNCDFLCHRKIYAIRGTVKDRAGNAMAGVHVWLSTGAVFETGDTGEYVFNDLTSGTYGVTPSKEGWTFDPVSRPVEVNHDTDVVSGIDFTGAPVTYSISGSVKDGTGAGIEGVTISTTGASTSTQPDGSYVLTGLLAGAYTVTPSMEGWAMDPPSRSATVSAAVGNATGVDFTATPPDQVTITGAPSGTPNPVPSGGQVQCTVTASDLLDHALSYQWTAKDVGGNAAGSFDDANKRDPKWTAPGNVTGTEVQYTISVTVTCNQGKSANGSYTQGVSSVPVDLRADLDHDGKVGLSDLAIFMRIWREDPHTPGGGGCPPPPYLGDGDLNHDARLNMEDLLIMVEALLPWTELPGFIPLRIGNVWQYELRAAQVAAAQALPPDRVTQRIVGTQDISGEEWFQDQATSWHSSAGPNDPDATTRTVKLRETAAGLYYYDDFNHVGLPFIDKRAVTGGHWSAPAGRPYTWDLIDTNASITVPAGTFTGCWRIVMHVPSGGSAPDELWERWFKRGVGLILERYWSDPTAAVDDMALLSYTVGS